MKNIPVLMLAMALALTACGGGGGGGNNLGGTTGGDVVAQTTNVPITVIDGPIQNATVCLDKNLNGACDAGEPTGTTDSNGLTNLTVNNADLAKYPVVAVVGTNAIDKDTGPVTARYVMKAPADANAVISPLTTLVQVQVETFAQTTAQATASVASSTGLSTAQLTSDYTKDTSASGATAYAIAQAMVVATQKQATAAQLAVGTNAIDGSAITQANFDKAVASAATNMLAVILSDIANSNTVTSTTTPKDRLTALQNLVTPDFLKNNGGLTSVAGAQVAVGIQTAAVSQSGSGASSYSPTATASLASFQFTDKNTWSARISQKTLVEATLDSNNAYKYRWGHYKNYGGGPVSWGGTGGSPARGADLHWNGSAWVNCVINHQNTQTPSDANGIANYNFCDSLSSGVVNSKAPTSATFDVGGQLMNSVYLDKISAANFKNIKIGDGTVSSVNSLLGSAVFPTGSKISYVTDTSGTTSVGYYPSAGNPGYDNTVLLSSLADSVGGDFTSGATQTACLGSNSPATKLEDLIARNVGLPCKFGTTTYKGLNGVSLISTEGGQTRNESWGWTTLSLGTVGTASVPGTASSASTNYTGNTVLRVAFAPNSVANFYACKQRFDYTVKNCDLAASGKYSINSLGDGSRTLTFTGLPPIAASLGWERVFVERNNLVYWGYKDLSSTGVSARLNKAALDALFAQLGLNTVSYFNGLNGGFDPASIITLNNLAYAGDYRGAIVASGFTSGSISATVGADGKNSCTGTAPFKSPATQGVTFICTFTLTPVVSDSTSANLVITLPDGTIAAGSISYYTGAISGGTWSKTNATPSSGTFTGSRI